MPVAMLQHLFYRAWPSPRQLYGSPMSFFVPSKSFSYQQLPDHTGSNEVNPQNKFRELINELSFYAEDDSTIRYSKGRNDFGVYAHKVKWDSLHILQKKLNNEKYAANNLLDKRKALHKAGRAAIFRIMEATYGLEATIRAFNSISVKNIDLHHGLESRDGREVLTFSDLTKLENEANIALRLPNSGNARFSNIANRIGNSAAMELFKYLGLSTGSYYLDKKIGSKIRAKFSNGNPAMLKDQPSKKNIRELELLCSGFKVFLDPTNIVRINFIRDFYALFNIIPYTMTDSGYINMNKKLNNYDNNDGMDEKFNDENNNNYYYFHKEIEDIQNKYNNNIEMLNYKPINHDIKNNNYKSAYNHLYNVVQFADGVIGGVAENYIFEIVKNGGINKYFSQPAVKNKMIDASIKDNLKYVSLI
jgi:hypothetical protein